MNHNGLYNGLYGNITVCTINHNGLYQPIHHTRTHDTVFALLGAMAKPFLVPRLEDERVKEAFSINLDGLTSSSL